MESTKTMASRQLPAGPSSVGAPARHVPLAPRTSIRIGGWARDYFEPHDLEDLRVLLGALHEAGKKPFLLGAGTNVVFPDGEYGTPVVSTRFLSRSTVEGGLLRAECGTLLSRLIQVSMGNGLSGLESLVGIPGTAGGALVMNAGGRDGSFGDRVAEVGLLPADGGPVVVRRGEDIAWGYRRAEIGPYCVAWVTLRLRPDSPEAVRQRVRTCILKKSESQPLGQWSAGCVFRNPPGFAAGALIDRAGLKGLSRGGARVSERHANFIVNADGSASAVDFRALVEEVRSRVAGAFGVRLETEVILA